MLYVDLIHTVRKMPKDKAGELFMTILEYVNDESPEVQDPYVDLVFEPVKHQLKRDLARWEDIRKKRSDAGKSSASKRTQTDQKSTLVDKSKEVSTVNVSVNVNDNVINIPPDPKEVPTEQQFLDYCRTILEVPFEQHELNYRSKYQAWLAAGWMKENNGKPVKINNWKTTIRNCVPHFKPHKVEVKAPLTTITPHPNYRNQ